MFIFFSHPNKDCFETEGHRFFPDPLLVLLLLCWEKMSSMPDMCTEGCVLELHERYWLEYVKRRSSFVVLVCKQSVWILYLVPRNIAWVTKQNGTVSVCVVLGRDSIFSCEMLLVLRFPRKLSYVVWVAWKGGSREMSAGDRSEVLITAHTRTVIRCWTLHTAWGFL